MPKSRNMNHQLRGSDVVRVVRGRGDKPISLPPSLGYPAFIYIALSGPYG